MKFLARLRHIEIEVLQEFSNSMFEVVQYVAERHLLDWDRGFRHDYLRGWEPARTNDRSQPAYQAVAPAARNSIIK